MPVAPTIREALAAAQQAAGRSEARMLLRQVLGCEEAWLIAHGEAVLTTAQAEHYRQLCARRARGEPIAYITGSREFYGREFAVAPYVLIPRHETELLVELALQRLPQGAHVLDLGAGSGCVGVTLAAERPDLSVKLIDDSVDALEVARINARRWAPANTALLLSDWYGALGDTRYDCIVSNPPYVAADDAHLARGDLRFEPQSALTAGVDGLDAVRRIIKGAPARLQPGGWLLLEHGFDQAAACGQLLAAVGLREIFSAPDLAGVPRVSGGRRAT